MCSCPNKEILPFLILCSQQLISFSFLVAPLCFCLFPQFPFPFSFFKLVFFCAFLIRKSSTLVPHYSRHGQCLLFWWQLCRREVRRHYQNLPSWLSSYGATWFGDESTSSKPHWHKQKEPSALQRKFSLLSQPFKIYSISSRGSHYNMRKRVHPAVSLMIKRKFWLKNSV